MKKQTICVAAAALLAAAPYSCSNKKSSAKPSVTVVKTGDELTAEYDKVFESYMTAFYKDRNAEQVMKYSIPTAILEKFRTENKYDSTVSNFEKKIASQFKAYGDAPDYKGIIQSGDMDSKHFPAVEDFLESYYIGDKVDITVTAGYEATYSIDYKTSEGETKNNECSACIVKVEGEGWKIIDGMTGDLLSTLYNSTTY